MVFRPLVTVFKRHSKTINTLVLIGSMVTLTCLVVYDVFFGYGTVYNLVSLGGVATYILLAFIFSTSPARVPANHLLSASVMSAPVALAISKLVHPEMKKTKTSSNQVKQVLNVKCNSNMIDAAAYGAMSAIGLAGMVCANLIAFVSLLGLLNTMLGWLGQRVGLTTKLTFELIFSYILWPLAAVMGVNIEDCRKVAKLIGIKTFVNEFVAYLELKTLMTNRALFDNHVLNNGTWGWSDDGEDVLFHQSNGTFLTLSDGIIDVNLFCAYVCLCGIFESVFKPSI